MSTVLALALAVSATSVSMVDDRPSTGLSSDASSVFAAPLAADAHTFDLGIEPRDGDIVLLPRRALTVREMPMLAAAIESGTLPSTTTEPAPVLTRARGIAGESRVFWYAAGASALASLGARVIAFVPGLFAAIAIGSMTIPFGPAVPMILFVALATGYAAVDAAIGALAGSLVFDRASSFYDSRFVAAFSGQFLGNALAVGVASLTFGYGLMLFTGVSLLTEFIGPGVLVGFTFFSFFGFLPAAVVAFFASIALPALVGSWALASTATPREGYRIDPTWDPFAMRHDVSPPRPREREVALSTLQLPFASPLASP